MIASMETQFIEAMLDVSRIEIAALLARQALPVDRIAEALSLPRGQVVRHLAVLRMAGLVTADAKTGQELYSLDRAAFASLSRSLHEKNREKPFEPQGDFSDEQKKVLRAYLKPDGSLREIPLQPKKLSVILEYVLPAFEKDRRYTEKEINAALARFHADTAALRRGLVDEGKLQRTADGRQYWRAEPAA